MINRKSFTKTPTHPADWRTPAEYAKENPRLVRTVSAIRWAIFNRARNGLEAVDAVRLVGGRWLVHHERFSAWRLGELSAPTRQSAA